MSEYNEKELSTTLISCITSYGKDGIPLSSIEDEFELLSGNGIPYRQLGYNNLKSFLISLPDIYVIADEFNNEIVVAHSSKVKHLKQLIENQKPKKRSNYHTQLNDSGYHGDKRRRFNEDQQRKTHIHNSVNKIDMNFTTRFEEFQKLETMLPILYKHQAIGDDFFVDLADTKLAYYVEGKETKSCGLCEVGMTISQLTEKVKKTQRLAPRVVVLIGLNDLIQGKNANTMIFDLRQLITELKKKNTRVTLLTLFETPKLKMNSQLHLRMEIFNKAIMEYSKDPYLQCNIIDMNKIFETEKYNFRKDYDRLEKISRGDSYKVFSDYGRKIFLKAIKSCLKKQIEHGH